MRFKKGDKVEFIWLGKLIQGVVTEIEETKNAISYQIKYSGAMGMTWLDEKELIAPTPVLKVPQFAGDWISRCKQREYDLACLLDYGNAGIPDEMYEWLISSADNQGLLARAWLDGYEVEKEPLYYVKLPYFGYVTNRMDYTLSQSKTDAVMLTESKIKRMDERYWQFAVPVEEAEGEA
ncbi:DUF1642 domain-containing protein [Listeria monocytogenes]|uniref:DUF1642 domain-containing protein n=1 Tax=Listeria monocytogenes TaxID=1639 RepID=A0A7U7LH52_LISMN|nr:DUF1642 domain-containing protein [Listeria monocytogenes]EAC6159633.1 DUF1642 domain-containing protein [Listeria monocytogenes]EAC6990993.1 DUF1642 domain-containing protein [Listeria monocytogenes]EAD4711468.1 DUF1642 domain-containing protein [Listeria monocytogenes]EAD5646539.1 DUF1642 domain-containing protein [Listeria monocytogenes]EAD5667425.1 DUF1642 domain-containing protein [Listeria monocytogenes]